MMIKATLARRSQHCFKSRLRNPRVCELLSYTSLQGMNMSLSGLRVFDETIHKTNVWLKEIEQALGTDRQRAYQALRAVLHCLRDRLTVNEAAQLGDQLPMLVRGMFYEAWHPANKPEKTRSREEFISKLSEALPDARAVEPEHAARAVFQVLEKHVTPGEIRDVIQSLPKEIRILWRQPEVQAQRAL
jgi:uncharacterized protein (DUF2267 family)